jgi:hypothetical protein
MFGLLFVGESIFCILVIFIRISKIYGGEAVVNSDELRSLEFPRIPSASRPEYFTDSKIYGGEAVVDSKICVGEAVVDFQGVAESSGRSKSAIFGRDENSDELRSLEFRKFAEAKP